VRIVEGDECLARREIKMRDQSSAQHEWWCLTVLLQSLATRVLVSVHETRLVNTISGDENGKGLHVGSYFRLVVVGIPSHLTCLS